MGGPSYIYYSGISMALGWISFGFIGEDAIGLGAAGGLLGSIYLTPIYLSKINVVPSNIYESKYLSLLTDTQKNIYLTEFKHTTKELREVEIKKSHNEQSREPNNDQ